MSANITTTLIIALILLNCTLSAQTRAAHSETLLVWTEGTGWKCGGSLAWQLYDRAGNPANERGTAEGVPVWGLAAAVALPNGTFQIIY